ncbi:MAG: hypothetical protein ACI35R_17435 [Bacillus sp. (in: firmicutes)]
MKITTLLIHRCTIIYEDQVVGQDPYGQDIHDEKVVEDIHCRLDQLNYYQARGETGTDYVTEHILFLAPDVDISLSMRITDIKDKYGNQVIEGNFIVEKVNPKFGKRGVHHFELELKGG